MYATDTFTLCDVNTRGDWYHYILIYTLSWIHISLHVITNLDF